MYISNQTFHGRLSTTDNGTNRRPRHNGIQPPRGTTHFVAASSGAKPQLGSPLVYLLDFAILSGFTALSGFALLRGCTTLVRFGTLSGLTVLVGLDTLNAPFFGFLASGAMVQEVALALDDFAGFVD